MINKMSYKTKESGSGQLLNRKNRELSFLFDDILPVTVRVVTVLCPVPTLLVAKHV